MSAHGVLAVFGLELPTAWAREHERLAVELEQTEDFGLHATLVGDDGERLLGFPWHDHVDRLLVVEGGRELPVELADGGWDDREILAWLFTPDDSLPGRPIDALRENRGREVKRRAQAEAL